MSFLNNFSQEVDDYIILSFQSFDAAKITSSFIKKKFKLEANSLFLKYIKAFQVSIFRCTKLW